jgi:hypothetical protein
MRRAALALLAGLMLAGCAGRTLFDGRTLAGWKAELISDNGSSADAASLFRVEGGAIHVYPDAPDGSAQPHAILVTDSVYADYRLHIDYRWGTGAYAARQGKPRDAGVLVHILPDTPGLVPVWYRWPLSLEYQIMEGDSGSAYLLKARATGMVDPATGVAKQARLIGRDYDSYKLARSANARERPGWNSVDIEVRGDSATFWLNGRVVNRVTRIEEDRPGAPVPMTKGRIALQAESAEVFYRNIRITPLR